jgi:hypothetical protein
MLQTEMRFDKGVKSVLESALRVAEQRGGEYRDSWGDELFRTPFRDALKGWSGLLHASKVQHDRVFTLAAMCDVKLSRLVGPYKADTFIDLINYIAVLQYELDQMIGAE